MNSKHLLWLLLLIPALAIMGCEGDAGTAGTAGPAGPPGEDGADGANGTSVAVCLDCHSDPLVEPSLQVYLEYAQSHHQMGLYVGYAGGRASCARCHSKQGYIEYAVMGDVAGDVSSPAAIDCATCHTVHPDDFGLRLTGPVTWIADVGYGDTTVDFADNSNTCAECHQSRRNEPNITDPGETFEITSTHYGPHHGAMANVLEGVLFAEIPGSIAYPTSSMHVSAGATCVTCHMETYTAGDSDAEPETTSAGGHTMWPNLDNCQGCHATADFNYGNVQADTQVLLDNLRDILVDLGVLEYVEEDEAYEPIVGTYPMVQAQAFFNWIGLTEDRSLGVHNPRYVDALLKNSIEANTPAN